MKSKHLSELIDSDFLPKSWERKRLDEVAYINWKTSNLREYNWINYTDISSVGTRTVDKPSIIKVGDAPSRARRVLRKGDTVISTVRPNRKSFFYFAGEWENAIASTGFAVLSPINFEDSEYLHAILTSDLAVRFYENICEGGAYPAFNPSRLAEFVVPWPPKKTRIELGKTVMNFQLKIEINKGLSKTLEDIAQTIFKSWFIDFDPVKAKMAGEKPRGMDDATAALFPDSMEESELGLIPKGWEVAPVGNTLDVGGGTTPSTANSKYWDGEHCWTTPKDLSSQNGIITTSSKRKITDFGLAQISSGLLPINSVLMSCRAPIGYVSINAIPTAVNQGFITLKHSTEFHPIFVLNWINANMREILNRAGGATFAEITRKAFRDIPFLKPANNVMGKYAEIAEPLLKKLEQLTFQTENFMAVRDLLLPRLISGELQIPEEMLAS
jgi:type I restriction enzyme S subunit